MSSRITVLDEPPLVFAGGQQTSDPMMASRSSDLSLLGHRRTRAPPDTSSLARPTEY